MQPKHFLLVRRKGSDENEFVLGHTQVCFDKAWSLQRHTHSVWHSIFNETTVGYYYKVWGIRNQHNKEVRRMPGLFENLYKGLLKKQHSHLYLGHLADSFIQSDLQWVVHLSEGETIYNWRYRKEVHRTKCKALTIARLTHSRIQQSNNVNKVI